MKYKERLVRNDIIVNLKETKLTQSEIGVVVGLSQQRISKLLQKNGETNKPSGAKHKLSGEQLQNLPNFLERGSFFYGFSGDYWTHKRVGYVIEKEYGVTYSAKQVGRILASLCWTCQKPQKKNVQQDPQKVAKWRTEELPNLKKKAKEGDFELFFHDESTLQLSANVVKTYSPRGKTPTLSLHDTKGHQYICLASSISEDGKMFYQISDKSFRGAAIVDYLINLLNSTEKKVLLIWDNATWHKSKEVKEFLNTETGKRLWVANTPPYSPECNPDELVWANLKRVQIPNRTAKNVKELRLIAMEGMSKIQNSPELIRSFFQKCNAQITT